MSILVKHIVLEMTDRKAPLGTSISLNKQHNLKKVSELDIYKGF